MKLEKVRAGVIGVGSMGLDHARRLLAREVAGMELTAVCDTDPLKRELAAEHLRGVAVFDNYSGLLDSGLCDAVIIATPHYAHPEIATAAFEKGLHVLSEKPAGVYTAQVYDEMEAARKSGRVFGIMYQMRTEAIPFTVREIVRSGRLGELKRVSWVVTDWYRNMPYFNFDGWRATWAGEGGGVLLNQAVHTLDLWQWIVGMPVKVRGFAGWGVSHDIEVEDEVTVYAEYENGATGTFITSSGEYPGSSRLEICGDRGKLVLEQGRIKLWEVESSVRDYTYNSTLDSKAPAVKYSEVIPEGGYGGGHSGICQNFTNAILHGEPLIAPGYDGINAVELINAIYLSDWTGESVSIPVDRQKYKAMLDERIKNSTYVKKQERTKAEKDEIIRKRWASAASATPKGSSM